MRETTSTLLRKLREPESGKTYLEQIQGDLTLSHQLRSLMDGKGVTAMDWISAVGISKSYGYQILRGELELAEDEPIPVARLGEVEQLLVCGQVLTGTIQRHEELANDAHDRYMVETAHGDIGDEDLALLQQCSNLRVLVLDYQEITDLSPLEGLPLEYLSLTGNEISNLSPLAGCQGLRVVDLGQNPIRDASVLAELPQLQRLVLEAAGITSLEVFRGCAFQSLNVRSTWVSDFTPLEDCPNLAHLIVGELPGGAVDTLAGLTNLVELRLYSTPGVDLTIFHALQALVELDVYGSSISHPEALAQLESLQVLNLGETGLRELSFLPTLPALRRLDLRGNSITDLTPLLDCPWLIELGLSQQHQPLVQAQLGQAQFSIWYE